MYSKDEAALFILQVRIFPQRYYVRNHRRRATWKDAWNRGKKNVDELAYLDPDMNCPASTLADQMIVSDFKDEKSILELAEKVDVLTYEIESANSSVLKDLESRGHLIHPVSGVLKTIQNKLRQKIFLKAKGIPVPAFEEVTSVEQIKKICKEFGYPSVLKACEDSYDGRGNFLIRSTSDVERGIKYFEGRRCMIEKYIHFTKEISVMVARNTHGQIVSFPVVQNIHTNGILDTTIVPSGENRRVESNAMSIARKSSKVIKRCWYIWYRNVSERQ